MISSSHAFETRIFTLFDVRRLFWKERKKWVRAAAIGAFLGFCIAVIRPLQYEALATFQEGKDRAESKGVSLKDLWSGANDAEQSKVIALMRSDRLLKSVVKQQGLQASILSGGLWQKGWRRIYTACREEIGLSSIKHDPFEFGFVEYEGTKPILYQLCFEDASHFSLFLGKKLVGKGALQESVACEDPNGKQNVLLTIQKAPEALKVGAFYLLRLAPWDQVVENLRSRLRIKSDTKCAVMHRLSFLAPDQKKAVSVLNSVMEQYRALLQEDKERLIQDQLEYLGCRQKKLYHELSSIFDEHALYLGENLQRHGVSNFHQNADALSSLYRKLFESASSLDYELKRLSLIEENGDDALLTNTALAEELKPIYVSIRDLKHQQGLLELAMQSGKMEGKRLVSMQEPVVLHQDKIASGLEGLSLISSEQLIAEYNRSLDHSLATKRHLEKILAEIEKGELPLGSLSAVFKDPFSQQLVQNAAALWLKVKDPKHHSEKEEARWQEELSLQKQILLDHVFHLCELESLSIDTMKEKLEDLRQHTLHCIQSKLSVLQGQIHDAIQEKKAILMKEKELIAARCEQLLFSTKDLPELWRREKWIQMNTELSAKMMMAVTEMVETKAIGHHLHQIESRILDPARAPNRPVGPKLLFSSMLGAMIAIFASLFRSLSRAILHGFPVSQEMLRAMRYPCFGSISALCDGPKVEYLGGEDLEELRQISLFLGRCQLKKKIGLFLGQGPDYSYVLASNLAHQNERVLMIRCDFTSVFQEDKQPGVLQLWQGKINAMPIRKEGMYDVVQSGGFTPYGTEVIQSSIFQKHLTECESRYERILLVFRSSLETSETIAALPILNKAVATIGKETAEQLTPFMDWAYHEDRCRLRLLTMR